MARPNEPERADFYHYEQSSTSSLDGKPPNHLGIEVSSHQLDGPHDPEKHEHSDVDVPHDNMQAADEDDDEDEDIDALIDDLESQDGQVDEEEEDQIVSGEAPSISEEFLKTSTRTGLTDAEVLLRRKKFGMNQMKEEKENLILKFLGYFIGPIQFVMEVCRSLCAPPSLFAF